MSAFVDTKVIVRHLTGDPPDLAARATAYLVACAERKGVLRVASFDKSIDRVGTVNRIEP